MIKKIFLLVLILSGVNAKSDSGRQYVNFIHVPEEISEYAVHKIKQTSDGMIWIASEIGLIKYNGSTLDFIPLPSPGPKSKNLHDIVVTKEGKLWLAYLGGGIALYDPQTNNFERIYEIKTGEKNDDILNAWELELDNESTLWVGTFDNGVFAFDKNGELIHRFRHIPDNKTTISNNRVNKIYSDNSHKVYFGTHSGVDVFDKSKNVISRLQVSYESAETPKSLTQLRVRDITKAQSTEIIVGTDNGIFSIIEINDEEVIRPYRLTDDEFYIMDIEYFNGDAWAGTANHGLLTLNKSNIAQFKADSGNKNSLTSNTVWDIFIDRTGLIWIGTTKGINILDPRSLNFKVAETPNASDSTIVNAIDYDNKAGRIYFSSGPNLYYQDAKSKDIVYLGKPAYFGNIQSLLVDSTGTLWVGTSHNGLFFYNEESQSFEKVIIDGHKDEHGIYDIAQASENRILLATFGGGIFDFNTESMQLNSLITSAGYNIFSLTIIEKHILAGTNSGLFSINKKDHTANKIRFSKNDYGNDWIMDVHIHSKYIYVGSPNGLYKLALDDFSFIEKIEVSEEESPIIITSITSDDNDILWIGTTEGIMRFNQANDFLQKYSTKQGLPFDSFSPRSVTYKDGLIYFGGAKGLLFFDTDSLKFRKNTIQPKILSLLVANQLGFYKKQISNHIRLNHDENTIRIKYALLDYLYPSTHEYKFKLTGLVDRWIATNSNEINFTKLPPGTYSFEVIAANSDGIWTEKPARLAITISPPWWLTWWAYTLYTLAALALLTWFVVYQNRRVARERAVADKLREADSLRAHFVQQLEEQVESATRELRDSMEALQIKTVELEVANRRALDASKLKSQFLAHISHELRTPMNGILGYADLLERTRLDDTQHDYLETIRRSGESLLATVNNLLDISKIEAGKVSFDVTDFNLRQCLEGTLTMLAPIAYEKGLELACIIEPEIPAYLRGDSDRLRQILTNLVGNAIKFTSRGSACIRVILDARYEEECRLTFAVSDTGIGITAEQREKLFTSFTQADPGIQRRFGGTGLGLSLSKMLVEAMGGTISLQSTPGIGTTVSFSLNMAEGRPLDEEWQPDERLHKATILLHDPHPLSAQAITSLLQVWGATVVETETDEALAEELERHTRKPRFAACVIGLSSDVASEDIIRLRETLGKAKSAPPLLVLASTLDMDWLCDVEVALEAPCLSKQTGARAIHQALVSVLDEHPQFSRTSRDLADEVTGTALAGQRILIADDNPANRELLRRMLRHAGAHTAETADGRETLDRLRAEEWDLLLLDIHMPGISGLEVIARIREGRAGKADLPVIAVTANALPEMRQWAKACGMDGYIIKPFTEEQLMSEIERVRTRET